MWVSLGSAENPSPSSRTKHSATLLDNYVYLFGGRNGNLPLKDLWRYNLNEGKWHQLEPSGDRPSCLQEHSAVAYKGNIYIFGGEVGFSAGTETPLWIYNTKTNSWRKVKGQKGALSPKGRRGHTALVYKGSMIIYGGYQDLRGSSNELWAYHFETESWHLLSPKPGNDSLQRPSGRHKHSAVLHDGAMWIYGGMTDLQERGDLWRWDIASKLWHNIKTKNNPGSLHSHAVCKLPSSMLVFGGECSGLLSNDLWRFHFGTEMWEKLQFPGKKPQPRAESIALIVSEILFKDKADSGNVSTFSNSNSSKYPATIKKNNQNVENNLSFGKNNTAGVIEKKYVFNGTSNNSSGNVITSAIQNNNLNFLKEISKISSINLSRLNRKCSYSMLNSSHDSTESLLKTKESSDGEHTPTRMVKSQSANLIANNEKKKTFSTLTPATEKMPYSIVESAEFSLTDSDKSTKPLMGRDPISIPNFNDLSSSDRPVSVYTPSEKLISVDSDETDYDLNKFKTSKLKNVNLNNIVKNNNKCPLKDSDNNKINLPGTPFFQDLKMYEPKVQNSESYNFTKSCQSDSYSSHLVSLGDKENTQWSEGIPKSASVVRFVKQVEINNELTSDYCSIETVNKVSYSSNYSQSSNEIHRDSIKEYSELRFEKNSDLSMKKTGGKQGEYGFSNPNYLGPDVQTILKSKECQSYGKILNSPPDSGLGDNSKSLGKNQGENVEMKIVETTKTKQIDFKISKTMRSPPKYLPLRKNPYNTTTVPIALEKKKKSRANSSGRAERSETLSSHIQRSINAEFSNINLDPCIPISVFLIGGKEQGQITVFKRPISLWKLQLSSDVY